MSTEQVTQFQPKPLHIDTVQPSQSSNKEYSGFSHASNVEPITYRPNEAHTGQFAVREDIGRIFCNVVNFSMVSISLNVRVH